MVASVSSWASDGQWALDNGRPGPVGVRPRRVTGRRVAAGGRWIIRDIVSFSWR